jgi:uncharacterized protein (TIGR02145 family)
MKETNFYVFLLLTIFLFFSCKKDENLPVVEIIPHKLQIDSINSVLMYSANAYASFIEFGTDSIEALGFCWNTSPEATLLNSNVSCQDTGSFFAHVMELEPDNEYYLRAFATTSNDTFYSPENIFKTWDGKLSDFDGNSYEGVQIGFQGWMAENLKTTHYSDGTPVLVKPYIPNRYYWYGEGHSIMPNSEADMDGDNDIDSNDSLLYVERYGLLYTWYSANNLYYPGYNGWGGMKVAEDACDVCPEGWHVPSKDEWMELNNYIKSTYSYDSVAIVLKSDEYWLQHINGIDVYGFRLIPGGSWHDPEETHWITMGNDAFFWTSTEGNSANGISIRVHHTFNDIHDGFVGKSKYGYSIRCIKNNYTRSKSRL